VVLALLAVGLRTLCGKVSGASSGKPLKNTAATLEMAPVPGMGEALKGVEVVQNPLGSGGALAAPATPLPSGWKEYSDEGVTWYVGPNGESQWEKPAPGPVVESNANRARWPKAV
jgi:hypothetical protein